MLTNKMFPPNFFAPGNAFEPNKERPVNYGDRNQLNFDVTVGSLVKAVPPRPIGEDVDSISELKNEENPFVNKAALEDSVVSRQPKLCDVENPNAKPFQVKVVAQWHRVGNTTVYTYLDGKPTNLTYFHRPSNSPNTIFNPEAKPFEPGLERI